jgi:two-component system, cell cycle sensor histidine kinase and response regulator CckA
MPRSPQSTQEEKKLGNLRVALAATTRCTQAVMHATDQNLLMEQVCSIIVDAGYRFCWVGAVEQDDEKSVRPLAWAGYENGYLSSIRITWSNSKLGRGPTGKAIRTAKPVVFQDLAGSPDYTPWQTEASKRGYRSSSALPLMAQGVPFGVLMIYADQPGVFDEAELGSLISLADILSFGITNLRERQEARSALVEASELNQRVISGSREGIIVYVRDLRCQLWNPFMEEITGVSAGEMVGSFPLERFPILRKTGVEAGLQKAMAGEKNVADDVPLTLPHSGRTFWVSGRHTPLRNKSGQVTKVLVTLRDVTERREAELALRRSEERLRQAARASHIGIFEHDHLTDTFYWSPEQREIYGLGPHEAVNLSVYFDHVYAEDREAMAAAVRRAHDPAGDGLFDVEHRIVSRDGNLRWLTTRSQTFFEGEGDERHKVRTVGAVLDITERRRMEEERQKLVEVAQNSPDLIGIATPDGKVLFVNKAGQALVGIDSDQQATSKAMADYVPRDEIARLSLEVLPMILSGKPWWGEVSLKHFQSGELIPVEMRAFPICGAHGEVIAIANVSRDIRGRKQFEETLRQAEEKYRGIFEGAVIGIFQSDLSGHYLSVNPAMASMLGYDSPHELLTSISDISRQVYVDPESRKAFRLLIEQQGVVQNFECQVYRKDGSKIWISVSARAVRKDGVLIGYEGTNVDITERNLLEQQLLQAQKMEAVGQLAGGVAHDFNNILGVIIGYADLSLGRVAPEDPVKRHQAQIKKAANRAVSLTRQLLAFSRRQVVFPKILDLNEVVHNVTKMLLRMVGEDIAISFQPITRIGSINADPGQIEQVLMNLVVNARDAMPSGGKIVIETGHAELDEHFVSHNPGSRAGQYVVLTVGDTGCGMYENVKSKIFEPFFTTKGVGQGTGLGLSTVYGIVKQSGGYICVYSTPGKGTTFKIYFPRVAQEAEELVPSHEEAELPGGSETILVVEDDEPLRELTVGTLRDAGYRVIEAKNAESALEIVKDSDLGIDLLLTDVIMPGRNGVELLEQAKVFRPNLRSLFISGYPGDLIARRAGLMPEAVFLEKPFTRKSLVRKVYSALHSEFAKQ